MSNEEQHRREGEPPGTEPAPGGERDGGDDNLPTEEAIPESVEVDPEEPGTVAPEGVDPEAAEEEEPEPEEANEIAREDILALVGELEAIRRERDEYLDNARRMKAELENSRKRQERERTRLVELASEKLVKELLPVLDNLERALEFEGDVRDGVRATREQLVAVLAREGLAPVTSDGQSFDPTFHEAVMGQPSDEHEEDTIIQTLERGYVLNGKPIRTAKVIVARQV